MLRRLLSFLVPVNVHRQPSALSRQLEVTWNYGKLVLDSQQTNYSYGSLQRILRKGLKAIGYDRVRNMDHILVLGVAGGSVIKTLHDEIGFDKKITGVEIDADVIAIANEYFGLDRLPNLEIVIDDAFEFVLKTKSLYDLIIIDLFQDTEMPNFLFEKFFVQRIGQLMKPRGCVLFNTMILSPLHETRNIQYTADCEASGLRVTKLKRVEAHNELLILEKKE